MPAHPVPALRPHRGSLLRVVEQPQHVRGECARVARRREQAGAARLHQVRYAVDRGRHHRAARGHRLGDGPAEPLVAGRHHVDVEQRGHGGGVGPEAGEQHRDAEPFRLAAGLLLQPGRLQRGVPDHDELRVRADAAYVSGHPDEVQRRLLRHDPAHRADHRAVRVQPELGVQCRGFGRRPGRHVGQVDRRGGDHDAARRRQALDHGVAGHPRCHRDVVVRQRPGEPVQQEVGGTPQQPEPVVRGEDVEGVHHHRGTGQPCCDPADEAGLRAVRVHHAEALAADQPDQLHAGQQVVPRRDPLAHVGHPHGAHTRGLRGRPQVAAGHGGDPGLVAVGVHAGGRQQGVASGPGDEPGDHVQHLDPVRGRLRGQLAARHHRARDAGPRSAGHRPAPATSTAGPAAASTAAATMAASPSRKAVAGR